MGSYDGAEVCELIGLFALNGLKTLFPDQEIGLYRDDGLAAFKKVTPRTATHVTAKLRQFFNAHGLKITTEVSKHFVNYLDITLNLDNNSFQPYRKPGDQPLYINAESNHPPTIIKQVPISVNTRISQLSCTQEAFDNTKQAYEEALHASGFESNLTYNSNHAPTQRKFRNRKRKIIWFNPPFSRNVQTNVAAVFLRLIKKHFPQHHVLHKIF